VVKGNHAKEIRSILGIRSENDTKAIGRNQTQEKYILDSYLTI